ncbi:MAG: AMIN domain-containing protein [Sulfuricurvum sp.]|uniref:AMIN domain-containing protein n=1 Tax=Sulfuricurvum sp. TaxID=2025608 RepID=UPI002605EDF7|nr:AMIN domain-containing protein [Sulfuricurvum sp.]MDD2828746.1 AMIN domain-containing protein [Sulfuricurvum sp.]MDD4949324.1 AMIN domain-containing protein [Sulfuricurvum sp.]
MIKSIFLVSIVIVSAFSRENPFFATSENPNSSVTSEKTFNKPPLQSMTYNFPDQARILQEVTFKFKNLDGSIETRRLEVDQSIDWRSPIVLSQSNNKKIETPITTKESTNQEKSFVQIVPSGNQVSILINEPMIRHFTLSDPNSVAIDFKHNEVFQGFEKLINSAPFTKAKITNHGKFARVILILDGRHECKVNKTAQGAQVICK